MLRKIPNILTIGRILIVPFFVLAFYLPGFYGDLTALILFIVASFTDFLDGMLARLETGNFIFPLAKNSLKPEIKISRVKIIIAAITS